MMGLTALRAEVTAITGARSIPMQQIGIGAGDILDTIGRNYLDDIIRAVGRGSIGSVVKRVLGPAGLVADAAAAGGAIGGAITGIVNPYGEDGVNPYTELKNQGIIGLGPAEFGWDLGKRIRKGWDNLSQLDQEEGANSAAPISPLQLDLGDILPSPSIPSPSIPSPLTPSPGEEIIPIPLPVPLPLPGEEENLLPQDKTRIVANVGFRLLNPSDFTKDYEDLILDEEDIPPPGTIKPIRPSASPTSWVSVTAPEVKAIVKHNVTLSNPNEPYVFRYWGGSVNYIQPFYYVGLWALDLTVLYITDSLVFPAPQSGYETRTRIVFRAKSFRSYNELYPNAPFAYGTSPISLPTQADGYQYINGNVIDIQGSLTKPSYSGGTHSEVFFASLPISLSFNGAKAEEAAPVEEPEEIKNMKCRALDAVKALESRLAALELKVEIADSKLGAEKIEEVKVTTTTIDAEGVETTSEEVISIDGIGGGIAKILENQFSMTDNAALEEIKKAIGPQITQIINAKGEPLEISGGIGQAIAMTATAALQTNDKLGEKITEIPHSGVEGGKIPITGGIGEALTVTGTAALEGNDKLGEKITEVEVFNPETKTIEKIAIVGGIGGATALAASNMGQFRQKFEKVRQWLMSGRILEILTFAATLHNAQQLSVSIMETLVQAAQNIVEAIGLKDDEGENLDLQELMKKSLQDLMISVLGKEVYEEAVKKWNRYNKIYQTGANILSATTSIFNALQDTTEIIGSYVGQIGNALKRYHVIADDAYQWMSEKMSAKNRWQRRLNAVVEGLEQAESITSNLEQVTSNTLEIVQQSQELYKESVALKVLLNEDSPDAEKGDKELIENKPIADKQIADNAASEPPDITPDDIIAVANKE
jgi:hypothetical protein